jgi:branched-chain amino acid aminotransferase
MPPIPARAVVALHDPAADTFALYSPHAARVSVFDRSFHFGDSLYEVVRTYAGIPFALDDHLLRLHASAQLADFATLPGDGLLLAMVQAACRKFFDEFGRVDVYVRLTISRGESDLSIDRRASGPPYAIVVVKDVPQRPTGLGGPGVHWALVERRRNARSALDPAMKSGNYLNNVLALAEAQTLGCDDALMLDPCGRVTEGTTSNFFCVRQDTVLTAPPEVGVLRGITRELVLRLCGEAGLPVVEAPFGPETLWVADEMFLSSSTREVQAISRLSGRQVGTGEAGPITTELHRRLRAWITTWQRDHADQSLWATT